MSPTATRPRVLIVGAGLAGTATAIRLLCFARSPLEIVLLERRPDYRCAGVAYHRDGNPWDHVFNVQAGRMSAFREDVLDFVRWANTEADRDGWPAPWDGFEFTEQGPAPRRIFQDYLVERLAAARQEACPDVVLVEADGEAVDLEVRAGGVEVTLRRSGADLSGPGPDPDRPEAEGTEAVGTEAVGTDSPQFFDHVILATGLELREPPYAAEVLGHPNFVRNPYSADSIRELRSLSPGATVVIVGSVLSAYDSAALLIRQGHTGTIHLISRSGTIFRTYPGGHEHGVVRLSSPETLLEPFRGREEFIARVRAEWDAACAAVARDHPEIAPAVIAERVAKAWEPYLPQVAAQIPSADLRRLLDEFSTAISALRVSAVEYTMSVIERAMGLTGGSDGSGGSNGSGGSDGSTGTVKLIVGRVEAITPARSGRLVVSVASAQQEYDIEADLVVSNFSREPDYSRVGRPLWRNLIRRGLAVPHGRTGRGVEVDEQGMLLGPDGEPVGPICAVGVLREGDEIVRNGRTGAFAFNLATIKNQSIAVAADVITQVELRQNSLVAHITQYREYVGTMEQAARSGFDEAVVMEVRRMATRTRTERELIDAQLGARIRSVGELHPLPIEASQRDRLITAVVSRAAVERITDVSVTPRQLRRQLGLANSDDPED